MKYKNKEYNKTSYQEPLIIPPADGWEQNTWYIVEVAFHSCNPIFGAVFYSGFLNGENNSPGNYNEIVGLEDKETISKVRFMRVLRKLTNSKELQSTPNNGKTLSMNRSNIWIDQVPCKE